MKLEPIGKNVNVLRFANGDELLFSYSACVAAKIGKSYFVTDKKWSATTARHISSYAPPSAFKVPQASLDAIRADISARLSGLAPINPRPAFCERG